MDISSASVFRTFCLAVAKLIDPSKLWQGGSIFYVTLLLPEPYNVLYEMRVFIFSAKFVGNISRSKNN
jgi:hypothetical protein